MFGLLHLPRQHEEGHGPKFTLIAEALVISQLEDESLEIFGERVDLRRVCECRRSCDLCFRGGIFERLQGLPLCRLLFC